MGERVAQFIDARQAERQPITAAVRVGWISDDKRMAYIAGQAVDISEFGLAVVTGQRLRISALVHVEITERGMVATGRVRNCTRSGAAWRSGIELMPSGCTQPVRKRLVICDKIFTSASLATLRLQVVDKGARSSVG
jgi:PilZ domain